MKKIIYTLTATGNNTTYHFDVELERFIEDFSSEIYAICIRIICRETGKLVASICDLEGSEKISQYLDSWGISV